MQKLDQTEGTFEVEEEITPVGHILGFMVKKAGGDWQQLSAARLILNETIQLSVSWANDSLTHSLKGHIALRILKPNLQEWLPTPVSGQDTIVAPNGSSYVLYEIPLDQKGTWRLYATLTDGRIELDCKEASFNVTAPGTASLEGKITSALYTAPAFGIRVEVAGVGYVESDANGYYRLENIPAGEQIVNVSGPGWIAKHLTLVFVEGESKVQDIQLYLDSRWFLEVSSGHPPISEQPDPIGIRGRLAVTSASNSKSPSSKGGIEMDAEVVTPDGIYLVEVVDWFYNGYADLDYGVGCIIYNPAGAVVYAERAAVPLGFEVSYELSIYGGTVHVNIASGLIDAHYDCNAQDIRFLATYLEYWWYPVVGTFHMNAYHMLESAWHPTQGWLAVKGYLYEDVPERHHLSSILGVKYVPYGDFFYIAGTIADEGIG